MKRFLILILVLNVLLSCTRNEKSVQSNTKVVMDSNKNVNNEDKGYQKIKGKSFIDSFEYRDKIKLDSLFLFSDLIYTKKEIPKDSVEKYLEKDSIIRNNLSFYDLHRYYPLYRTEMYSKTIIVYARLSGAGGRYEEYFIKVLPEKNELIKPYILAKLIINCDQLTLLTGELEGIRIKRDKKVYSDIECQENYTLIEKTKNTVLIKGL